jgi:hypothetical protein
VPFLHNLRDTVGRDKAPPRTQKGWTLRKLHQAKPEDINGIRERDLKEAEEDETQVSSPVTKMI